MKLTIETLSDEIAVRSIEWNGKIYSETWFRQHSGNYSTKGKCITQQMEEEGICADGTDIELLLDSINMDEFIELAEREMEW